MARTPRIPGLRRVLQLSGARRVQADVDDELRFHLDMRAEMSSWERYVRAVGKALGATAPLTA